MSPIWVFGYGSLIWNPGFAYDARVVGFVRDYRRVFYQGSTDHRGTPQFPGRTVTLEHQPGATCWGVAYRIKEEDKEIAIEYLEVREKQYDEKVYLDLYTDSSPKVPAVESVMVYFATANKESNQNYLGPAPLDEMARQIYLAEGPSGPNREYVFKLEDALNKLGMTPRKRGKTNGAAAALPDAGIDRINALPIDTLHHALSFLPTEDAVRTCVLVQR